MILELLLGSIDWIAMHPPGLKIGKISTPIGPLGACITLCWEKLRLMLGKATNI